MIKAKIVVEKTPKKNETWHVRLLGNNTLNTMVIKEATATTVLLHDIEQPDYRMPDRYTLDDVEFIEKVL